MQMWCVWYEMGYGVSHGKRKSEKFVKKGGDSVVLLLVRLVIFCMAQDEVHEDWWSACILLLYKSKRDKNKCLN